MKSSKSFPTLTSEQEYNNELSDRRWKIIILWDSHARGYAEEISHLANKLYNIIVYAKPNTGVSTLMNVAKEEFTKLTKSEILLSDMGQMTSI